MNKAFAALYIIGEKRGSIKVQGHLLRCSKFEPFCEAAREEAGQFYIAWPPVGNLIELMPRRVKKGPSILAPLTENFVKRLSSTDQRLRRRVMRFGFWAIGILFVYSLMSGTYGIPRIVRMELQRRALVEANRREMAYLVDAARIRDMLKDDRIYIEYIARTRYHMAYPDETIYRYRGQ